MIPKTKKQLYEMFGVVIDPVEMQAALDALEEADGLRSSDEDRPESDDGAQAD